MLVSCASQIPLAHAELLQGSVQDEDMRLTRPGDNNGNKGSSDSLRIERPMPALAPPIGARLSGLVDTSSFNKPLSGRATDSDGKLGLLQPAQFGTIPANKFDLGADRSSRELVLAWEKWHHQLSAEIYSRWSEVASVPGRATLRVTVSRNRTLTVVMVSGSGSPAFDAVLLATIQSLNGNPGLSFPAKSERQQVTFEADYVAATDIQPGFSWVKNDYEKVRQDY